MASTTSRLLVAHGINSSRQFSASALTSQLQKTAELNSTENTAKEPETKPLETASSDSSLPWYMRSNNEDLDQLNSSLKEPIPELPSESPEPMGPLVEYLVRDLGLTEIQFIDLRDRDPVSVFGPDAIMVLATGKNDRHIGKATQSLLTWIKHNYNIVPYKEGIYTASYIKVQRRRQKKKSKKLAMADDSFESLDSRLSTNWVTMDTKLDNIILHIFTEDKRQSVDLEYVWAKNKKELRAQRLKEREEQERLAEEEYARSMEDVEPDFEEDITWKRSTSSSASSSFGTGFGSVRNFHTLRPRLLSVSPPPNPPLSDLYTNIISSASNTNTQTSTLKSKEDSTPIQQLQLYSFLGNYKKANDIYRSFFSHRKLSQDFDLLKDRSQETEEEKIRRHNSNEAILLLLKAHINFLSKLKPSSQASANTTHKFDDILSGIGGHLDHGKFDAAPSKSFRLTKQSDVISSFISCFPYYPTRDHWKLRLIFFQRAHMASPSEFPIDLLVEIAIFQQASCEIVDNWDIEFIVNSIIHTKQFDKLSFMKASQEKSRRVFTLLCDTVRPLSPSSRASPNTPTVNDAMMMLLYRLWTNDKNKKRTTMTPSSARLDPSPTLDKEGAIVPVAEQRRNNSQARVTTPISLSLYRYLIGEIDITDGIALITTEEASRIRSFLILSLTAFANDGFWSPYWSLCAKIFKSPYMDPEMLHIISALVTKSGDQKAMDFLVTRFAPKLFMYRTTYVTSEMVGIINSALAILDPNGQGYKTIRAYIS